MHWDINASSSSSSMHDAYASSTSSSSPFRSSRECSHVHVMLMEWSGRVGVGRLPLVRDCFSDAVAGGYVCVCVGVQARRLNLFGDHDSLVVQQQQTATRAPTMSKPIHSHPAQAFTRQHQTHIHGGSTATTTKNTAKINHYAYSILNWPFTC